MRTLGRILIILVTFTIVMGIAYVAIDAGASSTTMPAFEKGEEIQLEGRQGELSHFPGQGRDEFDEEGRAGGRWLFGLLKNLGIIAVIVVLVTLPKKLGRRKSIPTATV